MRKVQRCRLNVEHAGVVKMVGKVFAIGGVRVFCHEEVAPTQTLWKYDSPGGVDVAVLNWLREQGVSWIHHFKRDTGVLYVAPTDIVAGAPQHFYDGRLRAFLPRNDWEERRLDYDIPWVKAERVIPADYGVDLLVRPPEDGDDDYRCSQCGLRLSVLSKWMPADDTLCGRCKGQRTERLRREAIEAHRAAGLPGLPASPFYPATPTR